MRYSADSQWRKFSRKIRMILLIGSAGLTVSCTSTETRSCYACEGSGICSLCRGSGRTRIGEYSCPRCGFGGYNENTPSGDGVCEVCNGRGERQVEVDTTGEILQALLEGAVTGLQQ